jgi:hypothetical protein
MAESEVVANIQASEIRFRRGGGYARKFAIGGIRQTVHVAEPASACYLRIEIEFCVSRQPQAQKQRCRQGSIMLHMVLQTESIGIG